MTVAGLLGYLPAPPGSAIHLGPLQLRAYGLMIGLGVVAAVWLAQRRWSARGGHADDIATIALWAVPAGVIGARIYHVVTDPELFRGRWLHVFAIWEGGLGIPGGIAGGVLVGVWVARRRGLPVRTLLDVVAPALPLAQAIGRMGNWFNQELFGRPTRLPWALKVDLAHRPAGYERFSTFHPCFLYELLWNLGVVGLLLLVERRLRLRPTRLFVLYIGAYAVGRAWVESLRIDHANRILGLRLNEWTSVAAVVVVAAVFLHDRLFPAPTAPDTGVVGNPGEPADAADAEHDSAAD